jgi:hypothetical protein
MRRGILVLNNPQTSEVHRALPGEAVFFRCDTWHHGFNYGIDPLRVLEFFAPPAFSRNFKRLCQDKAEPDDLEVR